jgi:hypothetical protein
VGAKLPFKAACQLLKKPADRMIYQWLSFPLRLSVALMNFRRRWLTGLEN